MRRIWVERSTGFAMAGDRAFAGFGHSFYDATDRPCETVMAGRPVHVIVEDDMTLRLRVETGGTFKPVNQTIDKPCPCVNTGAMGPGNRAHHYWLEEDGMPDAHTPDLSKPAYRVPLMSEVRELEPNGFSCVSTFSGCGGSSTGYRMAGFKMLWASEFVEAARDTYRANAAPYTILDGRDIRTVQAQDILDATGLKVGELDLFDGSPPCASFSTAGKREKGWGKVKKYSDKEQRSDDLFFEYVRLIDGTQPKAFVAENVSGLVKGSAKGYFLEILAALKKAGPGYRVSARVLDAQWLGVPQSRQRLIFVGVRSDLVDKDGQPIQPCHPLPMPYRYSIRDALPWITRAVHDTSGEWGKGEFTNEPSPAITVGVNSVNSRHYQVEGGETADPTLILGDTAKPNKPGNSFPRGVKIGMDEPCPTVMASSGIIGSAPHALQGAARIGLNDVVPENIGASLEGYAIGEEWDKLEPGEKSDKYFSLIRPHADAPCPTVTASGGGGGGAGVAGSTASVTHPEERRKFSIAELRRICGFPDDFILTGTYAQQWERLGRAVPPVMMSYIAACVRDNILKRIA